MQIGRQQIFKLYLRPVNMYLYPKLSQPSSHSKKEKNQTKKPKTDHISSWKKK